MYPSGPGASYTLIRNIAVLANCTFGHSFIIATLINKRIKLTKMLTCSNIGRRPYFLSKKKAGTFPSQLAPIMIAVPLFTGTFVASNI